MGDTKPTIILASPHFGLREKVRDAIGIRHTPRIRTALCGKDFVLLKSLNLGFMRCLLGHVHLIGNLLCRTTHNSLYTRTVLIIVVSHCFSDGEDSKRGKMGLN